jgi:glycosyltransferase XagB
MKKLSYHYWSDIRNAVIIGVVAGILLLLNISPSLESSIGRFLSIDKIMVVISVLFSLQSLFTLFWMLYAWEDPDYIDRHKSPKHLIPPLISFSALLPARHEEKVIADTIRSIANLNYPAHLKELLVLCREDDLLTIEQVNHAIQSNSDQNIRLITFNDYPINKPHSLNIGLNYVSHEVVTIFDAEDQPYTDIYNVINTIMHQQKTDVVQSGVQLMNYRSHWFSALNVMEYYLWFKSGLRFFLKWGNVIPLGGNTVFFKREWLDKVGGWNEECLTEDADIGIRLAAAGAKQTVIYDEQHVTQEETPTSVTSFVKQRTRWIQGFLQIVFINKDWTRLPEFRQKIIALYILSSPLLQALMLIYTPFALFASLTQNVSVFATIVSYVPLYLLVLQVLINTIGLYEFTKSYKYKYPIWIPFKLLITFLPYQFLLVISSYRAIYRFIKSNNEWEKTFHSNNHRGQNSSLSRPIQSNNYVYAE